MPAVPVSVAWIARGTHGHAQSLHHGLQAALCAESVKLVSVRQTLVIEQKLRVLPMAPMRVCEVDRWDHEMRSASVRSAFSSMRRHQILVVDRVQPAVPVVLLAPRSAVVVIGFVLRDKLAYRGDVGPPVNIQDGPVHGGVEDAQPDDAGVVVVAIVEAVVGLGESLLLPTIRSTQES